MQEISKFDNETKEYFYSLPFSIQKKIINSDVNITCREDIQRYFTNLI